eukprot:9496030-Pyramimonas_sp.AAC.1
MPGSCVGMWWKRMYASIPRASALQQNARTAAAPGAKRWRGSPTREVKFDTTNNNTDTTECASPGMRRLLNFPAPAKNLAQPSRKRGLATASPQPSTAPLVKSSVRRSEVNLPSKCASA